MPEGEDMSISDAQLKQAIANCDRDPIHIPGTIQGFGALVAGDRDFERFTFISANAGMAFGSAFDGAPGDLLNASTSEAFSAKYLHEIRNALSHGTIEAQREVLPARQVGDTEYQVSIHRKNGHTILEAMPECRSPQDRMIPIEQARAFLAMPLNTVGEFIAEATERLRNLIRYDRVKFYQFLPDGAGDVVAEARHPSVPSFLGLRFPSTDVPPIARRLYATTPIRVIHDVNGADIAVLGLPGAAPLDMSLAILRGKDRVHQQYLVNMGVHGTLTVPVVVGGKLWGMFASHHMTVQTIDPATLNAAELAGKLISLRIQHALEMKKQATMRQCLAVSSKLVAVDDSELAASVYWDEAGAGIAELIPCDGVLFFVDGKANGHGQVPDASACQALLALADPTGIAAVDDLQNRLPGVDWGGTGGALVIAPPGEPAIRLVYLRNLAEAAVRWAGQPEKDIVIDGDIPRLTPRNSFDTYLENVRGRSTEWASDDIEIATALREAMSQSLATQAELRESRERLGLMVRELNHRVRNILSLVQSLSHHSRAEARSVEAYADALEKRIIALAGAHNLLTRSEMQGVRLRDLVRLELRPYVANTDRATVTGPDVAFRSDASSILVLLFHELTSNAVKYGALSTSDGTIEIGWQFDRDGIAITWRERGGPAVTPPTHAGFGRSIIEDALRYEFQGEASLSFDPAGVEAAFWLPGNLVVDAELTASVTVAAVPSSAPTAMAGTPRRALVVEDNFVVAMLGKRILRDAGFTAIDAAASIDEALAWLDRETYDFCLLDLNLHGEMSIPVARHLERLRIPFVLATGYGSDGHEIVENLSMPVIAKPIDATELNRVLSSILGK